MLALLAASTGCLGFGGGDQLTPETVEETPSARTETGTVSPTDPPTEATSETATATTSPTETASPTPTETDTPSPTEAPSPTPTDPETPTSTRTPTPTPTPREAQAPPEGSLSLGQVTLEVREGGRSGEATVTVSLSSDSTVTFTLIELRVDLYYDRPFGDRRQVGTGYIVAEDEEGVSGRISGTFTFDDRQLDGSEPERRYAIELQYRRVRYQNPA